MRVSVAMCTYNGARHLREQLASIEAQTPQPDELVICDDGSTDDTVAILRRFAAAAAFPVRVSVNAANLGSIKNFEQAIGLCTGDVIALCDQDDVWLPHKLEKLTSVFAAEPGTALVFSDAEIVDEDLQAQGFTLWTGIRFDQRKRRLMRSGRAFEVLLAGNVVTGATMALRASYRDLVLPIPDDLPVIHDVLIHDGWIALMIALVAGVTPVDEPLIRYRQHSHQLTRENQLRLPPRRRYLAHAHQLRQVYRRAQDNAAYWSAAVAARLSRVQSKIGHLEARAALPRNPLARVPVVLRELLTLRYHRFSNGLYSAALDLTNRRTA